MLKIAYFELTKLVRDRRWLALILIQPILMIILMGSATLHDPKNIKIAIYNKIENEYSQKIIDDIKNEKDLKIKRLKSENELKDKLSKNEYRGGVIVDISKKEGQIGGKIEYIENSTVPEISSRAKMLALNATSKTLEDFTEKNVQTQINKISNEQSAAIQTSFTKKVNNLQSNLAKFSLSSQQMSAINQGLSGLGNVKLEGFENLKLNSGAVDIKESKNTTKKVRYFDFYASAVVMLLVLITCLNMSSNSITQERIDGTFERFFVTPYTKTDMIIGKMLPFSVISLILAFITIGSLYLLFHASLGPLWLVLLITYLTSLSAVAIGLAISSITHTVAESIQVSITIFFTSLIITQFIFQIETMHPILAKITWFMPYTYSIEALRAVNLLNLGFMDVWQNIAILAGSVIVFISLAIILLHRKAD